MHFTIDRKLLINMIKKIHKMRPGTRANASEIRLYACAARVFIEANGATVGEEALVFRDGSCRLPMKRFQALLESYANKPNVTIDANEKSFQLFSSVMPLKDFAATAMPPASFVVGRVTDTWVSGVPQL